ELMESWGHPFSAYLDDESQEVAKAYQAACTPDIYMFDANLACVYRGRLDGATPKNAVPLTGEDLRGALDNLLAGKPISEKQIPSIGCNIKWKAA
ncbi:MAG: thioredoxin family protein, partial [Methylobacter sp.]